jgi:hypothetical protein
VIFILSDLLLLLLLEKNEMGGACGIYGGRERCVQGVGGETRGKETTGKTKT